MAASALRAHLYCPHAPHPSPRCSLVASPSSLSLLRLSSLHCSHTKSLKFSQSLRICPPESSRESAGLVMCMPESSDVGKTASAVITEEPTSHQAREVLPLNGEEAEAQVSNGSLVGHEDSLDSEEETESDEAGEEIAGRVWDDATIISAQESYGEVNKIIASRAIENRMFYFIEWKDGHEPSWLPSSSIAKDVLAEYESPWWKAARAVDEQKLRELLEDEGRDMDAVDENGRTALLFASGLGSEKCVRLLVEAGAEVDGQDLEGLTPLHMAAGYVKQKTVSLLLELGADPEMEDSKGRTALTLAEELIARTPKANPLQFARRLALENILKLLESEVFENAEVEQVLDKRPTGKGGVEYLVKWKDGSEDEWVSAESVADDLVQDYEAGLEYGIAEEILDKRDENRQVEYLVKWADIEKPTWEPPENVASELIAVYEKMPVPEVEKMLQQSQKSEA